MERDDDGRKGRKYLLCKGPRTRLSACFLLVLGLTGFVFFLVFSICLPFWISLIYTVCNYGWLDDLSTFKRLHRGYHDFKLTLFILGVCVVPVELG